MVDSEAAHIFPYSTIEKRNFSDLTDILNTFWGHEKAQEWSDLFQDESVTESPQNLVCLNHQLHWWLDNARLALKPLRNTDSGAVVVQFHWLKVNRLKPHMPLEKPNEVLPFSGILSKAGLSDNGTWGDKLAHRKSGLPLQTGQTFVLGAKDPERAPSFELLQLSWDLLRVGAISGAAGPLELDNDDDTDNSGVGYWDWEENELGQWRRCGSESGEEAEETEDRGRSKQPR